jgi:hypothetical protein
MLEMYMKESRSLFSIVETLRKKNILAATCQLAQANCISSNEERFIPVMTVWVNTASPKQTIVRLNTLTKEEKAD